MDKDEMTRVASSAWARQWEPTPDGSVRESIDERKVYTRAYAQALQDVADAGGLDKLEIPPASRYFEPKPLRTRPAAPIR